MAVPTGSHDSSRACQRDEVLSRTNLPELCDELLGPHKGHGRGAQWPCPAPNHGPQTGKTPPVTAFQARSGEERWRCHACGAGGTAIDLMMVTQGMRFADAIEALARRSGTRPIERTSPSARRVEPRRPPSAGPTPHPAVEAFVASCEQILWKQDGAPMRRFLAQRGFTEEVLRVNRVGADPGPAVMPRDRGLPHSGPAVVLPVLGRNGEAVYFQSRYLHPSTRRYDNPTTELAGVSPRVAECRLPIAPVTNDVVLVCEGIVDGLTAAQIGIRSAAVLGAGLPDARAAEALARRFPREQLVLAFDADEAGRNGDERLTGLLSEAGAGERVRTLAVPLACGDVNGWLRRSQDRFAHGLFEALQLSGPASGLGRGPSLNPFPEDLSPGLEVGQ